MKYFRVILAIAVSALSLTMMQSCSSDNAVVNPTDEMENSTYVYNYDLSDYALEDASIDNDFIMEDCSPMHDGLRDDRGDKGNKPKFKDRFNLGRVFGAMNLTEEQKLELRSLMASHRACEMEWFIKLNEARKTILAAFRTERNDIMAKVKSGEITRREAQTLIDQLNIRVRQAIANLPINEEVKAGLILCRDTFFASIKDMLTAEQLVLWERFLASLPIR